MHYKVSDTLELQGGDNEVLFQTMHAAVEAFDRHARCCNGMQYWLAGIDSGHQIHQLIQQRFVQCSFGRGTFR